MALAAEILERLVAFPSISKRPNADIVGYVAQYLEPLGAQVRWIEGPQPGMFNLIASFGPRDGAGYVLSGHLDVVPANEPDWNSDPFVLRKDGDRLVGRGAVDMKGFIAAVLAAAPGFASSSRSVPIHIALSYDEEVGCAGVPHLLAALPEWCARPLGAVIGEPSGLCPVLAHKGKIAIKVTVHGKAGHSSRTDLGDNAIQAAAEIVRAVRKISDALTVSPPRDERFAPPWSTVQVGTITGGRAINIIPDLCSFEVEARAIPAVSPERVIAPIHAEIARLVAGCQADGREISVGVETISSYPPLALLDDAPLALLAGAVSGTDPIQAVSYGTEAGLFQKAGIASIVCGPGDIARAHKPNEYILVDELDAAVSWVERFAVRVGQ